MRAVSEATQQIVEFEELVSRLDHINAHHHHYNIKTSRELLPQLSSALQSPSLSPTSVSMNGHQAINVGRKNSSGVVVEPYTRNLRENDYRLTRSLPNTTNYVMTSGNFQKNCHQSRQQDEIFETNNDSSLTTHPDPAEAYGSRTSDLYLSGQLHLSYFHDSPGSAADPSYHPLTPNISNARASSFPVNGTADFLNSDDLLISKSLQQQQKQLLHRNPREKRVRVNIGIDEDLRMILEMDPSIVDRQPPTPPPLPPRRPPPPPPPLPPTQHAVDNSNSFATSQGMPDSRVADTSLSPAIDNSNRIQVNQATSGLSTVGSSAAVLGGNPPRSTQPQGWYWTPQA